MRRVDNPELKRKIIQHLAVQYKINTIREPGHLSSYIYCLTRAWLDYKYPTMPTDEEVMLFAIGYGLQDVLTPKAAKAPVYEKHGIIYSPDMSFQVAPAEVEQLVELKTTRKSAKNRDEIPQTWLDYMLGGCYLRGTDKYDLIVLFISGNFAPPFPQIYCDTYYFEQDEIEENWERILLRKAELDSKLKSDAPPTPYKWCYDWESKYCRYSLVCQALKVTMKGEADE